jgi:hypothetical protein
MKQLLLTTGFAALALSGAAQARKQTFPLSTTRGLQPVRVAILSEAYRQHASVKVADTARGLTSELKYAKLSGLDFHNGMIEVELAGQPQPSAGATARGFVGLAFRIDEQNTRFECIYLRPTNGRAEDQVRRNHSVQYVSYPDYPWEKLRRESPEKYESYVDLETGQWTNVRIEVRDNTARLYVHGAAQPTLIVSDLKHGSTARGSIGLWIGSGTEAHFRNLRVTSTD